MTGRSQVDSGFATSFEWGLVWTSIVAVERVVLHSGSVPMRGFMLNGFEKFARHRLGWDLATEESAGRDCRGAKRPGSWERVAFEDFWVRVEQTVQQSGVAAQDLLRDYGREMFQTLVHLPLRRPVTHDLFQFLQAIEAEMFPELDELVEDLDLPALGCQRLSGQALELVYVSSRKLGDLAEGLILGSIEHFQERVQLRRIDAAGDPGRVTFVLTRD